jgi:hypothetical protein
MFPRQCSTHNTVIWMIILTITSCSLTKVTGLRMLYIQTTTHSLPKIIIHVFRCPFPIALGMSSTRTFCNIGYSWIMYNCTVQMSICTNTTYAKNMPTQGLKLTNVVFTSTPVSNAAICLPANTSMQAKNSRYIRFAFAKRLGNVVTNSSCFFFKLGAHICVLIHVWHK